MFLCTGLFNASFIQNQSFTTKPLSTASHVFSYIKSTVHKRDKLCYTSKKAFLPALESINYLLSEKAHFLVLAISFGVIKDNLTCIVRI